MKIRNTFWALCLVTLGFPALFAQVSNPLDIAAAYLKENAKDLGLTADDTKHYRLSSQHVGKHNKLTYVYLEQTWADIPVVNAIFNLNIKSDGDVLHFGNRFIPNLQERINTTQPRLSAAQAITAFTRQMQLPTVSNWIVDKEISDKELVFAPQGQALEPIRVKLVYQPLSDKTVRLAWQVSFYVSNGQNWWLAAIDAVSGELIDIFDQVLHSSYSLDEDCETEGSHGHYGYTHTHSNLAAFNPPPPPSGVEDGTGTYNVLPLTVESPSHGERIILNGPVDSLASPFGWHDTDGEIGAEYTITRGNNVHAYNDIFNQNVSNGDEPDGGDSLVFDFPMDLASRRPYTFRDALVTNLFYWNNLMHDFWYRYGFDEAAGNFQEFNYGNGGAGGDYVRAEALDGSGTNNANFATPPDGQRPRMQMFLWGGSLPDLSSETEIMVRDTAGEEMTYGFIQLAFGGELPSEDERLELEAVLADDGVGNGADLCEPAVNTEELAGKLALVDRGDCEFGFKSLAAQEAGAVAVIICNNDNSDIFAGGPGAVGNQVEIPVVMISLEACNEIKLLLEESPVTISLSEPVLRVPEPGPSGISSDLDNGVIVHEYTHGISIRLTGGRNTSGCLQNQEQAGEGWSDWFALVMTTTADMTAGQRRGIGTYATGQPTSGRGIRTFPYSRDFNVNPHTYADINGESIPHGVGSVWCAMIWDLYWNLIDVYGFDEDHITGTGGNNIAMQLVLDGIKMQPCNPNFIESRDAIIAADEANNDGANVCLIWETFARRGLGVNAAQGGIESFDTPNLCLNAFVVEKEAVSDAFAGEQITYDLSIINGKANGLSQPLLIDTLPEGVTFLAETATCPLTLDGNILRLELDSLPSGDQLSCSYTVQTNEENFSFISFFDGLEGGLGNFTVEADAGEAQWRRALNTSFEGRFSWFSSSPEGLSDHSLITLPFELLDGERPGFAFYHRYQMEEGWDGGVVELTTDGGQTWTDLAPYMIKNAYSGRLNNQGTNPIAGSPAFTGSTGGEWIQTIIELSEFVGEEVQIRFRYVSDDNTTEQGWFVDNITLFGNLFSVTNVICAQDEEGEFCSEATTIIFAMPTSTDEVQTEVPMQVFPNPATTMLQVRFGEQMTGTLQLSLLNLAGQRVLAEQFPASQQVELDVKQLPAGIYFLQAQSANGQATRKVIIR